MKDVEHYQRIEVIDHTKNGEGRAYIKRGTLEVKIQVQDDGKTLKIFIKDE